MDKNAEKETELSGIQVDWSNHDVNRITRTNQICSCKICFNGKQQGKQKNWKEVKSLINQKDRQQSLSVLHVYQWYLGEKDTHVLNTSSGIWIWYDSYPFLLQLSYMLMEQVIFILFKNGKREWESERSKFNYITHIHTHKQTTWKDCFWKENICI